MDGSHVSGRGRYIGGGNLLLLDEKLRRYFVVGLDERLIVFKIGRNEQFA